MILLSDVWLFFWGAALSVDNEETTEQQILTVEKAVLAAGVLQKGDITVITMGSPIPKVRASNLLKIHEIGNP